jgi:hypothetical protein
MNEQIHHNKVVRNNGQTYRIIAFKLGKAVLVDAECVFGPDKGQVYNLRKSKTNVAAAIRQSLKLNLVS